MSKVSYRDFKNKLHFQEFDFDAKPDLNEEKAKQLRDTGIEMAMENAEKVNPGWSEIAYEFFINKFLLNHNGPFMGEDVRSFAALMDVPLPPSARAWGGIFVRAKTAGIIERVGFKNTRNKKAHLTPATLWRQVKPSKQKQ